MNRLVVQNQFSVKTISAYSKDICLLVGIIILCWDDNFAQFYFAPHEFSLPHISGGAGIGQILALTMRRGGDEFRYFNLILPLPTPSLLRLTLIRAIIVNFSYLKSLHLKQTNQYSLIQMHKYYDFCFCCDIVMLNTWIILLSSCRGQK